MTGVASTRRRPRLVTLLAAVVTASVAMIGLSEPAFADGSWSTSAWSGCSRTWTYNQYGGDALAHESYSATTSNSKHAVVNWANVWVDNLADCGPAGHQLNAYAIRTTVSFRLRGTALSCSIGYPASFSCTVSGSDVIFTFTNSDCQTYVYSCSHSFGQLNFYAQSGQYFSNVIWMQTTATLIRSDGQSHTWQTSAV
jgi:hypothetical protein